MKVLLIQPPRYYWPYISEGDNYLLPQSLPCLAAVLRENKINVKVIDCLPLHIGWNSLAKIIKEEKPDVVGIGENHALFYNEAGKAFKIVKEINPQIITIGGGCHISNWARFALNEYPIDFIVMREGEKTLLELVNAIERRETNYEKIDGIVFKRDDEIIETQPQKLIEDLDSLPIPAYDLLPMEKYGRSRFLFSPYGTTIHHSRGCISNCKFCAWWLQMAEVAFKDGEKVLNPRWRTKSVDKTVEEIELLYNRYKKRCFVFVDEVWNLSPGWSNEFAEKMIRKKLKLQWMAFMRIDSILRDEELGIFEKLVKSGLCHVAIGVEREFDEELNEMGKNFYSLKKTKECFRLLKKKYPGVFRQGTFIVGLRNETKESMYNLLNYAKELELDYPGFHPITPLPGTELWKEAKENGWIEVDDFREYDFMTPVMSSYALTRRDIEELTIQINRKYVSIFWFLKGVFSKSKYKRNMYIWWLFVTIRIFWDSIKNFIFPFNRQIFTTLVKPRWYDN